MAHFNSRKLPWIMKRPSCKDTLAWVSPMQASNVKHFTSSTSWCIKCATWRVKLCATWRSSVSENVIPFLRKTRQDKHSNWDSSESALQTSALTVHFDAKQPTEQASLFEPLHGKIMREQGDIVRLSETLLSDRIHPQNHFQSSFFFFF